MSLKIPTKEEFPRNASLAAEALMFAAASSEKPLNGNLDFMIEEGYASRNFSPGASFQNDTLTPQPFPNDLDTFVERTLAERDCIGLVPLSEEMALKLRGEYGLRPILVGVPPQETPLAFEVYHKPGQ